MNDEYTLGTRPFVSLVVETHEAQRDGEGDMPFTEVLAALEAQSYGRANFEILVVLAPEAPSWLAELAGARPGLEVVLSVSETYFGMKLEGAAAARGDVIAFIDSDVKPSPTWLASLVAALADGADVSLAQVRYVPRFLSRWLDFVDWGHVQALPDGRASSLVANNVAFRSDVWKRFPFDERLARAGACYHLGGRLRQAGCKMQLAAGSEVRHSCKYSGAEFFVHRLRAGYDSVVVGRLGPRGVLVETRAMRLGLFGPFAIFLARLAFDARSLRRGAESFGFRNREIPFVFALQVGVRTVELASALLTAARPGYLAERFGW
jgi:hypothetical protein